TICAHMKNALIENVYIHTPKLRTATKNPYTAPLSCDMYSSTLTNVLIKVDADYTLKNNSFGSMTAMYGVYSSAAKFEEYSKFTNVVVISKDVLASYANNTDIYTVDAENCTATNKLVGVKRYTSVANAPNVTTTYWKIANGAITWGK
ncbi:MAG: hypothetical protein IJV99_03620, partial [Clostridia bacterium]|nr:hypothetical protein [Clostridia bacterium]